MVLIYLSSALFVKPKPKLKLQSQTQRKNLNTNLPTLNSQQTTDNTNRLPCA